MRIIPHNTGSISPVNVRQQDPSCRLQTGVVGLDSAINGGFAIGRVHEVFAASSEDAPAGAGFVLALAMLGAANGKPVIWIRSDRAARAGGNMLGAGWAEHGGLPGSALFVLAQDTKALLRASVDALRCGGLGAVVVECWGRMPELDLTASRRLSLAAAKLDGPLLLLRVDAQPAPSAAETRWSVAAAPSQGLPGKVPGPPCFDVELLRCRSRPSGQSWRLEWDRDRKSFRDAAVPGTALPVPIRQQVAETGTGSHRRAA